MKSKGVIYLHRGSKCTTRLAVSLHSLRKHYSGNVAVLHYGPLDTPWIKDYAKEMNAEFIELKTPPVGNTLEIKTHLHSSTPFDISLFLDADTLVLDKIDYLFEQIEQHGLVFTAFADWVPTGRKISKRIENWSRVVGEKEITKALNYPHAINTGVFGFDKTKLKVAAFLMEWQKISADGYNKNCTRRLLDEVAAQVLLHKYADVIKIVDKRWNVSVRFGPFEDKKIVHYHGSKHVGEWDLSELWKDEYWELRNQSKYRNQLGQSNGDRRLRRYLRSVEKNDITIVSAVNPKYLKKVSENIDRWMKMRGLREQQFLIFVHGWPKLRARETRPIRKYTNVKVVKWDLPKAKNDRELMLSSFVLGVAKHVDTKFWMKLDGDCTPKVDEFVWPNYSRKDVIAHRWGYTKMKGDENTETHWLNRLDRWWKENHPTADPMFPRLCPVKDRRHNHKRYCSFCCIERTELTKQVAEMCDGRLPIPSQDTTMWYSATRWNKAVERINFKEFFSP